MHSLTERQRTYIMASLRQESTSVHDALPTILRSAIPASTTSLDSPKHPDWPYRMLTRLSGALCNHAVRLSNTSELNVSICSSRVGPIVSKSRDCVPAALIQRLWEITSYVERNLQPSM